MIGEGKRVNTGDWASILGDEVSDGVINFEKKYVGRGAWGDGEKNNGINLGYFWEVSGISKGV